MCLYDCPSVFLCPFRAQNGLGNRGTLNTAIDKLCVHLFRPSAPMPNNGYVIGWMDLSFYAEARYHMIAVDSVCGPLFESDRTDLSIPNDDNQSHVIEI